MSNAVMPIANSNNIVPLMVVCEEGTGKRKKNGELKKTKSNKVAGKDAEVYAFRSDKEINAMLDVLNQHIYTAPNPEKRKIACRNKLLFKIGINIGLRASDLRTLKFSFFFDQNPDGTLEFKEYYKLLPKKTQAYKKYVTVYFNSAVKQAVLEYLNEYPMDSLDDYLFFSREGGAIKVETMWTIIKSTAKEAGIRQNIGSHSLRKSFGYHAFHSAEDKNKALVMLQQIFNHSNALVTMRYIGILGDEMADMFNSIDLGFEE